MASGVRESELAGGDSDEDDFLNDDMEALKRACMLSGTTLDDYQGPSSSPVAADITLGKSSTCSDSDDIDDIQLLKNIRDRFSFSTDPCQPLSLKRLSIIQPLVSDEEDEDDFETLRAIQRRFAAYDNDVGMKSSLKIPELPNALHSEGKSSDNFLVSGAGVSGRHHGSDDSSDTYRAYDNVEIHSSASTMRQQPPVCGSSVLPPKNSSMPKSALVFVDAIKKNRSFQKFLRSKLIHIEAKIEQNKKLRERFKILRDFQVSCKKKTGRALSQKRDPRIQLISLKRPFDSSDSSKVKEKKLSALYNGPAENTDVASYRMALTRFPLSVDRKKWSKAERENLGKGIRQQFQEMLLQISIDRLSMEGPSGDSNDLDNIIASIKDLDITPERLREFLPKVDWDKLASMYAVNRSGAECEARWLNFEDPLINHNPWTTVEDKNLLVVIQEKGINNWFDIAVSLQTNRTPFQCLARYQRSLNASILKREWTTEEDNRLRSAVETYGVRDWQAIASILEGRTGTQCSNRWTKTLDPGRTRRGPFTAAEDKRLKIAVMLFGPKNWHKKAQFLPGRTQVQCRERWFNSLDPSLRRCKWTEEEDLKLEEAIKEHGYSWAKVATCVPPRTDCECRRRWTRLFPHEVPLLQAARRIQKAALMGNFVDRESERPALGPNDFRPIPVTDIVCQPEGANTSLKSNRSENSKSSRDTPKETKRKKRKPQDQAVDIVDTSDARLPASTKIKSKNSKSRIIGWPDSKKRRKFSRQHLEKENAHDEGEEGRAPKEHLRSERSAVQDDPGKLGWNLDSTESGTSNVNFTEILASNGATSKKKRTARRPAGGSKLRTSKTTAIDNTEPLHSMQPIESTATIDLSLSGDCEAPSGTLPSSSSEASEIQKRGKGNAESPKECQVGAGSFRGRSQKWQKPKSMSYLKQNLTTSDGEDIPLASFIRSKSMKRRLEDNECDNNNTPELSRRKASKAFPEGKVPSLMTNGSTVTTCEEKVSGNLSNSVLESSSYADVPTIAETGDEPGRPIPHRHWSAGVGPDSVGKAGSLDCFDQQDSREDVPDRGLAGGINKDVNDGAADIPLACLLQCRLKRKKARAAKDAGACHQEPDMKSESSCLDDEKEDGDVILASLLQKRLKKGNPLALKRGRAK